MSHFTYIRLHSGRKFHFLKPRAQDIHIDDIAHNLSNLCRFTGACNRFYSVASHCVMCAGQAPEELKLQVLLHDSFESLGNDIASPLKVLLPQYKAMELKIEQMIARKYGLQFPFPPLVKEIDLRMLVTEMKQLMAPHKDYKELPFTPYDVELPDWSPEKARREFLKAFRRYSR